MPAPLGSIVGLHYDTELEVEEDEYLQTPTGRTYLVLEVRVQARGKWAKVRKHLRVMVVEASCVAPLSVVHPLRWYKR